jgi:hypothetical protein
VLVASPAFADIAAPQAKMWRDGCAARLDEVAQKLGLPTGARASVIPLRHENGTPNPVQYVEYATPQFRVMAGDEPEPRPDQPWHGNAVMFRRFHNRFAKIERAPKAASSFKEALDECLKMGDLK